MKWRTCGEGPSHPPVDRTSFICLRKSVLASRGSPSAIPVSGRPPSNSAEALLRSASRVDANAPGGKARSSRLRELNKRRYDPIVIVIPRGRSRDKGRKAQVFTRKAQGILYFCAASASSSLSQYRASL